MALFIEACWKRGAVCCSPADTQAGLVFLGLGSSGGVRRLLTAKSSINRERFQMQTDDVIDVFILYLLFSLFAFLSIYFTIYLHYQYNVSIYLTMLRVSVWN